MVKQERALQSLDDLLDRDKWNSLVETVLKKVIQFARGSLTYLWGTSIWVYFIVENIDSYNVAYHREEIHILRCFGQECLIKTSQVALKRPDNDAFVSRCSKPTNVIIHPFSLFHMKTSLRFKCLRSFIASLSKNSISSFYQVLQCDIYLGLYWFNR